MLTENNATKVNANSGNSLSFHEALIFYNKLIWIFFYKV